MLPTDPKALELLAQLDHQPALQAIGSVRQHKDLQDWVMLGLYPGRKEGLVRAAIAAGRLVLPVLLDRGQWDEPAIQLLRAAEGWLACPCPKHMKDAKKVADKHEKNLQKRGEDDPGQVFLQTAFAACAELDFEAPSPAAKAVVAAGKVLDPAAVRVGVRQALLPWALGEVKGYSPPPIPASAEAKEAPLEVCESGEGVFLIRAAPPPEKQPVTRIGGHPLLPAKTRWPKCKTCKDPMQFVAQVRMASLGKELPDGLLLVFCCQNNPGECASWSPTSGCNAVLRVPVEGLKPLAEPDSGETLLPRVDGVRLSEREDSDVIGRLGGTPDWVQADETPECRCGEPMTFVASFEETAGGKVNFGDEGRGYTFACRSCPDQAKFLWQCA